MSEISFVPEEVAFPVVPPEVQPTEDLNPAAGANEESLQDISQEVVQIQTELISVHNLMQELLISVNDALRHRAEFSILSEEQLAIITKRVVALNAITEMFPSVVNKNTVIAAANDFTQWYGSNKELIQRRVGGIRGYIGSFPDWLQKQVKLFEAVGEGLDKVKKLTVVL